MILNVKEVLPLSQECIGDLQEHHKINIIDTPGHADFGEGRACFEYGGWCLSLG